MADPISTLLIVLVVILVILTGVFLGMLILVLVTLKKTLDRLQRAINTVEDTALRSLTPFLSLRAMFSNTRGFMDAITTTVKVLKGKKK
ncbi:MAG: hypothetical protein ABI758_02475 [Candidatus Woesebacteria bacterium]